MGMKVLPSSGTFKKCLDKLKLFVVTMKRYPQMHALTKETALRKWFREVEHGLIMTTPEQMSAFRVFIAEYLSIKQIYWRPIKVSNWKKCIHQIVRCVTLSFYRTEKRELCYKTPFFYSATNRFISASSANGEHIRQHHLFLPTQHPSDIALSVHDSSPSESPSQNTH